MKNQTQEGIFINGKAQILEMLKYMNQGEKSRLIENIRHRNPQLADEMRHSTFGSNTLEDYSEYELRQLCIKVNSKILGLALKQAKVEFQKRILSIAPRNYAEEAYNVMTTNYAEESRLSQKALKKVSEVLVQIRKVANN